MMTETEFPIFYRAAREVSKKHGLKLSEAMAIVTSGFSLVAKTMREGSMEGVLLAHLGTFRVKHKRVVLRDNQKALAMKMKKERGNLLKNKDEDGNVIFTWREGPRNKS